MGGAHLSVDECLEEEQRSVTDLGGLSRLNQVLHCHPNTLDSML